MSNTLLTTRLVCMEILLLIDNSPSPAPFKKWLSLEIPDWTMKLADFSNRVIVPALESTTYNPPFQGVLFWEADETYHGVRARCSMHDGKFIVYVSEAAALGE